MSLHVAKFVIRPLALASAALVVHIGAATAADAKGVQQQMREVLTGTTTAHFAPQSEPRDGKVAPRAVDSQEFVRQILLGSTASRVGNAEKIETQKRPVAYGDVQVAVRQVLLGQQHARDAS